MPILGNQGGGGQAAPEQVVTGTGSYTVPAGKFGYLSMSTAAASAGAGGSAGSSSGHAGGGSGSANANHQWISEGTSIATVLSAPSSVLSSGTFLSSLSAYAIIRINGTNACVSAGRGTAGASNTGGNTIGTVQSTCYTGWSIALYSA